MKKLLTFIFLTSTLTVMSQSWAPVGANWTYGIQYVFTGHVDYCSWNSLNDTTVLGKNCRFLSGCGGVDGDYNSSFITYDDSDIIYMYNDSLNSFSKLYDFNADTGEIWTTQLGFCQLEMKVTQVKNDTINGKTYKSMRIRYREMSSTQPPLYMWVNRMLGGLTRPLPFFDGICNTIIPDYKTYTELRCYQDSIIGLYKKDSALDCYRQTVGIKEVEFLPDLSVYPNPFVREIHVDFGELVENARLFVINSLGQTIFTSPLLNAETYAFDLNCIEGMYILGVSTEKGRQYYKLCRK